MNTQCWLRRLLFVVTFSVVRAAHAEIPIHDGTDGMTCYFFAESARLEWERKGGDWADSTDTPYGDLAYSSKRVAVARGKQRIVWDITSLAERWQLGIGPVGAVFLRALPGAPAGIVNFSSRESLEPDSRPVLEVEWDDGFQSKDVAFADAHFACPTHRASGSKDVFQISDHFTALLAFAFQRRDGRRVKRALLALTTGKQYSRSTEIGVFTPLFPWASSTAVENGLAAEYQFDQGIEAHHDVIFAERYEASNWQLRPNPKAKGRAEVVSSDSTNAFEQFNGDALRIIIEKGQNQGLNQHLRFADKAGGEPEEAYFRYYLRFGDSWDPSKGGGKLPGLSGTYNRAGWGGRRSDGTNGWSVRGAFFRQAEDGSPFETFRGIGSYAYYAGMEGKYGSIWGWNLGPTGLLEKNRWYSVEQHVRLNNPGKANGVFRAWIDGKLVSMRTGIDFRSVPELKIESVWLNVYHGGTAKAPRDLTLFIDNLVVARNYIGPVGGAR